MVAVQKEQLIPPILSCRLSVCLVSSIWLSFCFSLTLILVCDIVRLSSMTAGPGQDRHVDHDAGPGDAHLASRFGGLDLFHGAQLAGCRPFMPAHPFYHPEPTVP